MDYKDLLVAAIIFMILLMASCIILILRNRELRLECASNEKEALERLDHMEALEKEVGSLSSLYDASLEGCRKKTEFYANITHELKTPLSVILGAIQLMERKRNGQPAEEDGTLARNFKIIRHNCYRMLRLTNNLLDLAKMEAGYLRLKLTNCDLDVLLDGIVQSVMPYAAQKQLNLYYGKSAVPVKTAVDMEKMERILLNLLSNSIKFTEPGGMVSVSSCLKDNRILIAVKDSGIGIPAEMQEEVFGRFKQAGRNPALEKEGCGIGLSLVKSFVELHNGSIRVESTGGRGSEFIIDLPVLQVNDADADPASEDYYFRIKEAATIEFADLHPIAS